MKALHIELSKIFRGLTRAHGHFEITSKNEKGKQEGRARTVREPVTADLWDQHLSGQYSLGIMPVDEQGNCWWGCIDIDVYPLDYDCIQEKIDTYGLPLVICRSKSGGAHAFLFLKYQLPAGEVQAYLKSYLEILELPETTEVFPKQTQAPQGKETGNWLNMPYFGDTRWAWVDGEAQPLQRFLRVAKEKCMTRDALQVLAESLAQSRDPMLDAPPCLQELWQEGTPEGSRNNALFSFGVLARQAHGENYETPLREWKEQLCPDFPEREFDALIASVGRSNAFYKCNDQPLNSLCDKDACRTCKYGIGGSGGGHPVWVDYYINRDGRKIPRRTIENVEALMAFTELSGGYDLIRKNMFTVSVPCLTGDEAAALLATLLSEAGRYGLPQAAVNDFLDHILKKNAINPVTDWLDTLPNVEESPVEEFVDHCGFTSKPWAMVVIKRWFIQAVAAADHGERCPNSVARKEFPYVWVLAGPQGTSKTSIMRDLLGLGTPQEAFFSSGQLLDLRNKDSLMDCVSNWIVELGEIDATFRRVDISALKAFLTKQEDKIRVPYGRTSTTMQRRTVFFATVNEIEFLRDKTGNRRYWPLIITDKVPPLPLGLSERLWGWAWHTYLSGEQWWLTEEEETVHADAISMFEDNSIEGKLRSRYHWTCPAEEWFLRISLDEICQDMDEKYDPANRSKIGKLLKKYGVEPSNGTYLMPPRTTANRNYFKDRDDDENELPMQEVQRGIGRFQ